MWCTLFHWDKVITFVTSVDENTRGCSTTPTLFLDHTVLRTVDFHESAHIFFVEFWHAFLARSNYISCAWHCHACFADISLYDNLYAIEVFVYNFSSFRS